MNVPLRSTQQAVDSADLDDGVMDLIRRQGGRATGARRVILDALVELAGGITAEQLATRIGTTHPRIHQSTIYRTLERFETLGIAYHTHLGHGAAQWHLAAGWHSYLVCQRCGAVTEADPALFASVRRKIDQQLGFEIDLQHLALAGTCQTCRNEAG